MALWVDRPFYLQSSSVDKYIFVQASFDPHDPTTDDIPRSPGVFLVIRYYNLILTIKKSVPDHSFCVLFVMDEDKTTHNFQKYD